jgi:hypothetical protein
MHRKLTAFLSVAMAIIATSPLLGQSIPKEQQSEVAVEIQMNRFRESPLYEAVKKGIEQSPAMANAPQDFDWEKIESVFVAIALPEDIAGMMALQNMEQTREFPTEMFARIKFVDGAGADQMLGMIKDESEEKMIGGKSYLAPKEDGEGPKNLLAHREDDTTLVFGTENYITTGVGNHLLSAGLQTAWGKMPNDGFRLAIDLQNSSGLIEEAVEMGKQSADNPMAAGFMNLILAANDIRLSLDLSDGNLLTLAATGKDDAKATELQSGLDGILGMGKMMGAGGVEQLKQQSPDAGRVLGDIINSLTAKRDGNDVVVAIPRPEGFEKAVMEMMAMSGMGGDF